MNYERLKTFIAVAERNSFSEAAKILFVSQPTITSQIKALEQELNTKLFERTTKKVELTRSAKVLLKYAREIVRMNDSARKEIAQLETMVHGDLAMGCSLTIGEYILPEFLKQFKEKYPHIQIQAGISNSQHTVSNIKDQLIDVGLIETPIEDSQITMEPFLEDELILIAAPDYFCRNEQILTLEQIKEEPLIVREAGSGTRSVVYHYLDKAGLSEEDLNIAMSLGSTEAVKAAVTAGLGVSFISRKAIKKEQQLNLLKAYPIKGLALKRYFYIAFHQDHVLQPTTELFLETLRNMVRKDEDCTWIPLTIGKGSQQQGLL